LTTYKINGVTLTSTGSINHTCGMMDTFSSVSRPYYVTIHVSGTCNSDALAQCVPDTLCTIQIIDTSYAITFEGICSSCDFAGWDDGDGYAIAFTDCTCNIITLA